VKAALSAKIADQSSDQSLEVLILLVKDLVDKKYPLLYVDDLATKARAILRTEGLRVIPITDDQKHLVGTISRTNMMAISSSISPMKVKGIMANPKFIASIDMTALDALREMIRTDEWCVPVTKSSQDLSYIGMLDLSTFIRVFLKQNSPKLSHPLSKIMSTQLVTCCPEDEIDNVWRFMQEKSLVGCPVVKDRKLVGVVTQQDMLHSGASFPAFESKKGRFRSPSKISSIMKTSIVSLKPTATVREAAELMLEKNIGRIPVIDEKTNIIGIVNREDIAKLIL
jgi:CBS domain-containing protein